MSVPNKMITTYINGNHKVNYKHRALKMYHYGRVTWSLDDQDFFYDGYIIYKSKKITMNCGRVTVNKTSKRKM